MLVASAIPFMRSEYATGQRATVMFSQDKYQDILSPSIVINFTLENPTLSNHLVVGRFIPNTFSTAQLDYVLPIRCQCSLAGLFSIPFQLIPPNLALLHWDDQSSIPSLWNVAPLFHSVHSTAFFQCSHAGLDAPQFRWALIGLDYCIYILFHPPYPSISVLLFHNRHYSISSICIRTPLFDCVLHTPLC